MTKRVLLSLQFLVFLSIYQIAAQPPNFVIIVSDDMGWTGSSVQMDANIPGSKSDYYLTPQLAAMAQVGMTFSQAYAPAPKCSPSRCSILTGRTPARNNFTNTDNQIAADKLLVEPNINTSLNGVDTTLAEWLKSINMDYRTAHFGKWHLGQDQASNPSNNGFDFNDGNTNNNDGNHGGTVQVDPKKIFDLSNRSIDFIQDAVTDDVPFYIQVSHYAVHGDIEARQETIDLYNDPNERPLGTLHTNVEYGAMTEDTDTGIGELLAAISNLGIDDNTYVIFMSDNGGPTGFTDNAPLLRGKTFIYEGGIRVPFIITGPNIAPNTYSTEAIVAYDLFPTIAELTGSAASLPANIDGQSLVPLLSNGTFLRDEPLYFHSPHYENNPNKTPRSAVVSGNYKLIVEYETGNNYLYDLSTDIGESNDISEMEASLTRELCIQLRDHLKNANASMPSLDANHPDFSGLAPDIDADELEDEWEFRELLSYTYGPDDDPDDDGNTNLEEYNAGTDPYVDESVLAINENAFFTAEATFDAKVKLYWFAMENGIVDFLEIERSSDANTWTSIGKAEADHSTYTDADPIEGNSYYRLKVVNTAGEIDYSSIVDVNLNKEELIRIYPNPSSDILNIQLKELSTLPAKFKLQIFDASGKQVKQFEKNRTTFISLVLENLPQGLYYLQLYTASNYTEKVMFPFFIE